MILLGFNSSKFGSYWVTQSILIKRNVVSSLSPTSTYEFIHMKLNLLIEAFPRTRAVRLFSAKTRHIFDRTHIRCVMATGSSRLHTEEVIDMLDGPTMEGHDDDLDLDVGSDDERYMGT